MTKSGKANKNQTAQSRSAANAATASQPLAPQARLLRVRRRDHHAEEEDLHVVVKVIPKIKDSGHMGMKASKLARRTACNK